MMIRNTGALPTYRAIMMRIAAAALAVAMAVGLGAFFIDMELVDDRIAAMAKRQSAAFLRQEQGLLERAAPAGETEAALRDFMRSRQDDTEGQFIIAELYAPDRAKLAEELVDGYDWVEDRLKQSRHDFPDSGYWYDRFFFDGAFFIQTMTRLTAADGRVLGYFEGVYKLPEERSQEVIFGTMVVVAASVLAVLATAAVLLPIFASFNGGVMRLSRELLEANIDTLSVLGGTIAKRDSDTHTHNYRVTILAIRLAETLKLDPETIRSLIKGAFLHDVGKIGIPDNILLKPGKLDEAEFAVMKTHVEHGIDIVKRSAWLADARDVVGCHHEKFDGTGYPAGLAGEAIPVTARIFAIADVFDALTSKRPYKDAMPYDKAMAILGEGRGRHFDPEVLDVFAGIAHRLHDALGARRDDEIEMTMRQLVSRYFREG